jgi:dTDP-4-amino-4,6-dideoxygalactose transaminase
MSLNEHKPYKDYPVSKAGLKITYELSKNVLSLPMHPYLKRKDIIYISNNIGEAINSIK